MAENTLGVLVAEITARNDKFDAALKATQARLDVFEKNVNNATSKIERGFNGITGVLGKVQAGFAALAGVAALGGLTSMIKGSLDAADALGDTAVKLGITTTELQEFQYAANLSGVSSEQMSKFIVKLNIAIADSANKSSKAAKAFQQLGIDTQKYSSTGEVFAAVLNKVAVSQDSVAVKSDLLADLMGKGAASLIVMANGLEEARAAAHEMGVVIDEDVIKQAGELNDKWDAMTIALKAQLAPALIATAPLFIKIFENIAEGAVWISQFVTKLEDLNRALLLQNLPGLIKQLDGLEQRRGKEPGLLAGILLGDAAALDARIEEVKRKIQEIQALAAGVGSQFRNVTAASSSTTDKKTPIVDPKDTEELEKQTKAIKDQTDRIRERGETLNLSGKALADYHYQQVLVETGDKALAEARREAILLEEKAKDVKEAGTKALQAQATATRKAAADAKEAAKDEKDRLVDVRDANRLIRELTQKTLELRKEEAEVTKVRLADLEEEIRRIKEEGQVLRASLGPREDLLELEKEITLARIDRQKVTDLATAVEKKYGEETQNLIKLAAAEKKANIEVAASQAKLTQALEDAILTTRDLEDLRHRMIENLFDKGGFEKSLDDIEDFGKDLGIRLIEGIAFGKGKLEDQVLIPNFEDIFGQGGIVGSIMGKSGLDLGSLFGNAFNKGVSGTFGNVLAGGSSTAGSGIFANVLSGGSSTAAAGTVAGETWGAAFSKGASGLLSKFLGGGTRGAGFGSLLSIGGGILGSWAGNKFAGMAGLTDSKEGRLGGAIGAGVGGIAGGLLAGGGALGGMALGASAGSVVPVIGTIIGAIIGALVGAFGGNLFKPTTTTGTLIRKGVKEFLKDIKASFAGEIDSSNYFLDDTKKLADQMFGGDFLKASKEILTTKAGPDLAKQLQALGTVLTADSAIKMGKKVAQTGTTFGNMLVANLGVDEIPDAIAEIVEKSKLSFDKLTEKLTEVFEKGKVSLGFYKDTIQGAVDIFFGHLPDAINVSKIALDSFTDDGIFSLSEFEKKLKETTDLFDFVAQSFVDAIKNSNSGEEAAKMFGEQLKQGLNDLVLDKFIQDFIDNKLFAGIDLSNGLDSTEIELLKERTKQAREEAERLKLVLGKTFDEAGVDANGLVDQIKALNAQLEELAQKRIQIRIELIQQLTQIGSLSTSESIAAQMQEFAVLVNRALDTIGRHPFAEFDDTDLQQMFDALGRMADLTVQQFQEFQRQREAALQIEIQAIQTALSAKIAAIQEELAAHVTAIQNALTARLEAIRKEYDARREKIQASMDKLREEEKQTREVFQARLDALEKELQLAQEFKALAESLQQTINGLVLSTSALSGPEQLAFLQRQADELRGRIKKALPEDRPELIQQLSQILQSQLQEGQGFLDPVAFAQLFQKIVTELQTLRDGANEEGKKAVDIQEKIAAATREMEAALKAIQARMEALQKLLEQLTQDENNAIAAAQKAAAAEIAAAQAAATIAITAAQDAAAKEIAEAQRKAAEDITEEQKRTEVRLIELAKARDDILKEQMARIVEQREILKEQLIKQFGKEEAERLLREPMIESVRHLITIHDTLVGIEDLMFKFINDENSGGGDSDSNASTMLSSPSALLPNQSAIVSPPPQGFLPSGNSTVTVNYAPTFNVNVPPSGSIEEDTRRLLSAVKQQTMDDVRTGTLGQEIVKQVRGRMGVGI